MRFARRFLLLMIVALIFGSLSTHEFPTSVPKAHAATRTIVLYAYLSGWNFSYPSGPNPTITVNQGDTLSFSLVNPDFSPHLLLIDFDQDGVPAGCSGSDKCSGNLSPNGGTGSISSFTISAGPGQYSYYCLYHSPAYMTGKFIVQGPDFGISAAPSTLTIDQSSNANSTIAVSSINGFAGQLMLSATQPSSWPSPFFGTNPVTVTAGTTTTSKLTIYVPSGATPGPYPLTITAHNSTTSHQAVVAVTVPAPSFRVSPSPSALTINYGATGISTITVEGSHGFSGTVSLTASNPFGLGVSMLSTNSIVLSSTKTSGTSTLNVTSSLGTFNVTVTATASSGGTHTTEVLVMGPDFIITPNPTSLNLNQGSRANLTITLSGVNGFSGGVSLSAIPSNGGLTASLSSSALQIPGTGTVSSTLTVGASASGVYSTTVPSGSYIVVLNASMGSLSHVVSIPLIVTSASFNSGILTNPFFVGGIAGAVVIVGVAVYVLSRRTRIPSAH